MTATLHVVDVAWFAPAIVLIAGAAGLVTLARRIGAAAQEVSSAQRRFRRVEDAMIPVRVETRRARASIDRYPRR